MACLCKPMVLDISGMTGEAVKCKVLTNTVLLLGFNPFYKIKRIPLERFNCRDSISVWNPRLKNSYIFYFTTLIVSWLSCLDSKFYIFYIEYIGEFFFYPFWGRKKFFFRNKNIYNCKRQVWNLLTKYQVSTTKTEAD